MNDNYIVTIDGLRSLLCLGATMAGLAGCSSDSAKGHAGADAAPQVVHIDRSGLTNVGLSGALDYADGNYWACRPGNDPNECYTDLDATEFFADGTSKVVKHVRAANPAFDCFYVYPTVDLGSSGNTTDFSDLVHVRDPLYSQAARFSRLCEVYAPLYRQQSLGGATAGDAGGPVALGGSADLAYGDVKAAFQYYMDNLNHGRKLVLMGHSQGTMVLQRLMTELFDTDATLRGKLISALLIGGFPEVPVNQDVGGTFQNIPQCTTAGQVGCVIGYNSYAVEAPPPPGVFGKAFVAGNETLCTTAGPLANNAGLSRGAYMPKSFGTPAFAPNIPQGSTLPPFDTPFAMFPDLFQAACVRKSGYHYSEVTAVLAAGDKRTLAPYRNSLTESIGFGLHVADYNLVLEDLLEAVRLQAAAAL